MTRRHEVSVWIEVLPVRSRFDPSRLWAMRVGRVLRRRPRKDDAGTFVQVSVRVPEALLVPPPVNVTVDVPDIDVTATGTAEVDA